MSFGNAGDSGSSEMSDINMTPLIDVMLVLLIIFIITIPVISHSVKVDLPKASNQPSKTKPDIITLSVDKDGKVYWNDEIVSQEDLDSRLKVSGQQDPQPEIQVRGDKSVEYQYVVQTMASVQRAGLVKLGFVTQPQQ